ncbi:TonB-dependent receptor [Sphingosinicella soli]|uniref:TonB-dependent receptor n=1 Tax=Sphingosinicella soli TaxID=333708 RepID=A0A7W7B1Q6_9SPHN|nr:TonB-dependent receptor [Sphingosinicella soli]MBB4631443.1 TonB-dependent receptor [Sphingosinicella soli]
MSKFCSVTRLATSLLCGGVTFVTLPSMALAQTSPTAETADAGLSGRVWQAGGDAALSGVIVRIAETGQSVTTDAQGAYRFGGLRAGTYTLRFDYLGYPARTESVRIAPGMIAAHDVVLGEDESTILVVGQRGAQAQALSRQRAADNVRNVVSADQAGRFPDFNAAESLRRVPGVSVQREVDAGEGRYVSIRGLDSGLNNTKINGMNAAQPEKENRRVPLDMIQTSALSSITVHKTLAPDQDADGIGGAVVLETATAFDYRGPVIDFTASGFYHDLADRLQPMVEGTLATRFGTDDRFGILVSGAWSKRKTRGFVFYQDEDYLSFVEDDPASGVTPLQYHLTEYDNERENISANLALNWAVSDATELTFKGSYNRLFDKELSHALYFEAGTDEYDDDGNLVLSEPGTANIFNQYEETELTQQSYVLNGKSRAGAVTFDYGVGYSTGKREEPFDNEVAFTKELQSNLLGYDYSGRFPIPNLTPADVAAIADPDGYVLGYNDIDQDDSKNTRWAANFDVTWEPAGSWLRTVKAGVKVERSRRTLFEANVMELTGPLTMEEFGVGGFIDPSVVGAPYAPWLSLDIGNLMRWRQYSQELIDGNPDFVNEYVEDGGIAIDEDSYTSDEDTYAGYVMAKGVWGNWDVVGGVRIDHTRVSSTNWELVELEDEDPVYNRVKGKADYTSVLPRLQINYRPSDNFVVRGAFYTSIARPEPLYISGATEISEEDGEVDVTIGNPGLKPAYAYNFDLSIERYFGSIGILSAGVYYKKIDRFIFSEIAPETEADRARFENDPRLAGKVIDDVITYTNGKSAEIYGVEFNLVRQFPELPGALGGLGLYANATFQKSKADTGLDGVPKGDFFNAPEAIVTGALTYQKYGVEASLAYSWRDRQTARFSSYNTRIVEEAHGSLDGQFSYQFAGRFKLFVNAVDILNSGKDPILDERYGAGSPYLEGASYTGRTVTFGINASF